MESLRLYPPAWMQGRHVRKDHLIREINIPQGSAVMVCAYSLHRNGKYWDRPDAFLPDRLRNVQPMTQDATCRSVEGPTSARVWIVNSYFAIDACLHDQTVPVLSARDAM
ncbi:cytochrome P450 [Bradyrhizobium sp. Pa8]|uniref:cytochrome P450 n=1 Tax=Bradyrhizobium sp. Pa8 TaxID=3386552 RepID=UPI00403F8C23